MDDKLHNFFSENEFDFQEPYSGHTDRFEKRLKGIQPKRKTSWGWMSVAASIILLVGFGLGTYTHSTEEKATLSSVSKQMEEVESYFVSTLTVELQEIENHRNLDTEKIIEFVLDQIEELEDDYRIHVKNLKNFGNQRILIDAMVKNYQKRLEILQDALDEIERIKNLNKFENELI